MPYNFSPVDVLPRVADTSLYETSLPLPSALLYYLETRLCELIVPLAAELVVPLAAELFEDSGAELFAVETFY